MSWTKFGVHAAIREDPVALAVVADLETWAVHRRLRVTGTTTKAPALAWHLHGLRADYTFFHADSRRAKSQGSVLWLKMRYLKTKPVLDDPSRRAALIAALRTRFTIPRGREDKEPSIPMSALADPDAFGVFTAAWDAVIDDIRRSDREWLRRRGVPALLIAAGVVGLRAGLYAWSKRTSAPSRVRGRR